MTLHLGVWRPQDPILGPSSDLGTPSRSGDRTPNGPIWTPFEDHWHHVRTPPFPPCMPFDLLSLYICPKWT